MSRRRRSLRARREDRHPPQSGGRRQCARRSGPAARHPSAAAAMAAPAGAGSARRISAAATGRIPAAARRLSAAGLSATSAARRVQSAGERAAAGVRPRRRRHAVPAGRLVRGAHAPAAAAVPAVRAGATAAARAAEDPARRRAQRQGQRADSGGQSADRRRGAAAHPSRPPAADDHRCRGAAAHGARRQRDRRLSSSAPPQAGVEKHDVDVGKYVLAGTADDIVQNLPGADKGVWLQYSMVAQFFGRRTSGVGFYDELGEGAAGAGRALQSPRADARLPVARLRGPVSRLGQRRQRARPHPPHRLRDAPASPAAERRGHLAALARARAQDARHGFAHSDVGRSAPRRPRCCSASSSRSAFFSATMSTCSPTGSSGSTRPRRSRSSAPISSRRRSRSSSDETQLERIRVALAPEIEAGGVSADSVGDLIIISVSNVLLFDSGKATVKARVRADWRGDRQGRSSPSRARSTSSATPTT